MCHDRMPNLEHYNCRVLWHKWAKNIRFEVLTMVKIHTAIRTEMTLDATCDIAQYGEI
jgi:hypothetical protein